jgi:glycosyltransferase involved in cell wall biosynthesis
MKIVQLITALGYGGAEISLSRLCNHLSTQHEVTVVHYKPLDEVRGHFNNKVNIIHIPLDLRAPKATRQLLKQIQPDVVHTHLGHADLIGFVATMGLSCKKILHLHNIWFKFNGWDYVIFALYRLFLTWIQPDYEVISISKSVFDHAKKRLGVADKRNHLVYNAIEDLSDEGIFKSRNKKASNVRKLLFVGRLEKQKALDILLKALALLEDKSLHWHLDILGDGSLRQELEQLAKQILPQGCYTFHGNISDILPFYQNADFLVVPSIFEGFSIVTIEAFRAGLPVVASNLEGPAELITHGENGLLFTPGNVLACKEAIEEILYNKELEEKLSKGARNAFEARFKTDFYFSTMLKIYQGGSV